MIKNSLVCDNLTIHQEGQIILKNISFTLFPGAFIRLEGPNGSGKTSFLRALARLDRTNSGKLYYNKCLVDDFPEDYNKIILYLSDKEAFDEDLTLLENLTFWAELYDSFLLLPATIATFSLENQLNKKVYQISKGFKHRLLLSLLFLKTSRIWLLDEPFVNLDKETRFLVKNLFSSHLTNGGIIIYSDHLFQDNKEKDLAKLEKIGYKFNDTAQLDEKAVVISMMSFKSNSTEFFDQDAIFFQK
jgi:heme exporter protein A